MIVMKHGQYAEWPDIECPNCRKIGSIDVEMFTHTMASVSIEEHDRTPQMSGSELTWEGMVRHEMTWGDDGKEDVDSYLIGLWCSSCGHDFTEEQNNEVGREVDLLFYHTKLAAVTAMLEAEGYRDVSIRHSKNREVAR
jgi:hypothetical protein